ncbi:hypothetical protein MKX03_028284 [Papaver bracteatum]|nr:hypothetical protein MKX03_028284 [Papaver bracteatum]
MAPMRRAVLVTLRQTLDTMAMPNNRTTTSTRGNIFSVDESGTKSLVHVLDVVFSALREKVMGNLENHASPETRATPGQPWVRGWDELKRRRGNPMSGNR